jgi:hypothetical protein
VNFIDFVVNPIVSITMILVQRGGDCQIGTTSKNRRLPF